ncbi:cysteine desulfurase [Sulfolobales archaeon SCGC AB-777_J03]|nr:cysteine desulfurase [Sulfolobales archaeon SCGC AB-777_J03]
MSFAESFRDLVPVTKKFVYLNHAAVSPTPLPVLEAAQAYLREVASEGTIAVNRYEADDFKGLREKLANLLNVSWEEISFVPNTSYGVNVIAHGLDLGPGDNVVTDSLEFPAVPQPFYKLKKRGVEVRLVRPNLDSFEDDVLSAVDGRTRLVAISHVSFNTGIRVDYERVAGEAHSMGAYIFLDVIQSAGAVKVDLKHVDFAAAGGYKWLMAPQGSGFLYVKKGLIEDPPFYGWRSSKYWLEFNAEKFEVDRGPRRFEIGTIDVAANLALAKSAEILAKHMEEVSSRVLELSGYTIRRLSEEGFEVVTPTEKRAGIVIFKVKDPQRVVKELQAKGIIASARGQGIRVSTHFYNTEDEIEKLISILRHSNG